MASIGEDQTRAESGVVPGALPEIRVIARRGWWVLLTGVVGLSAGLIIEAVDQAPYASTAVLSVTADADRSMDDLTRAAQALGRVATVPGVVSDPLEDAGQLEAAADPRRFVAVETAPEAPLLSVTGTADDPEDARAIARVVVSALRDSDALSGFDTEVVAPPAKPDQPTRPSWVVPAGLAALAGGAALVVAATLSPSRRRRLGPGTEEVPDVRAGDGEPTRRA